MIHQRDSIPDVTLSESFDFDVVLQGFGIGHRRADDCDFLLLANVH